MTKLAKTKEILSLIVGFAGAIVALSEIYAKIKPELKKIITPLLDECKKVSNLDAKQELEAIECK